MLIWYPSSHSLCLMLHTWSICRYSDEVSALRNPQKHRPWWSRRVFENNVLYPHSMWTRGTWQWKQNCRSSFWFSSHEESSLEFLLLREVWWTKCCHRNNIFLSSHNLHNLYCTGKNRTPSLNVQFMYLMWVESWEWCITTFFDTSSSNADDLNICWVQWYIFCFQTIKRKKWKDGWISLKSKSIHLKSYEFILLECCANGRSQLAPSRCVMSLKSTSFYYRLHIRHSMWRTLFYKITTLNIISYVLKCFSITEDGCSDSRNVLPINTQRFTQVSSLEW